MYPGVSAAILFACQAPIDPAPSTAPGLVLLANQSPYGDVTIAGTVRSEALQVDLDGADDRRQGFAWRVVDAEGAALWERSTNGPVLVRKFLGYYSDQAGVDLLGSFPKLGSFAVQVPILEDGVAVEFFKREEDRTWTAAGRFELADADGLDQGLSDAVEGHETLYGEAPTADSPDLIDVVLVGDGYTIDQQEQWHADAASAADRLMATAPFATYPSAFRISRVDAVSAEAGASFDCDTCSNVDNAFGSLFPLEAVNRLTGSDYNARALVQTEQHEVARALSVVPWDVGIVVVNSAQFGGMAVHHATVTTVDREDEWEDTAVHEFGHALGLLGDEYVFDACIRSDALGLPPNISEDPTDPPWLSWVDVDTRLPTAATDSNADVVGAFKGAYNCDNLYRPMRDCKMRNSAAGPFCPVCTEALILRFARFTDSIAVEVDGRSAVATSTWPDIAVEWRVDGEVAATTAPGESFRVPARGRVEAIGVLRTDEVRDDPTGDSRDVHVVRP